MPTAQDDVFTRLAIERGLLTPEAAVQVARAHAGSGGSLAQALVSSGRLDPRRAASLLAELTQLQFSCLCGATASFEELGRRRDLSCACGRWLEPRTPGGASQLIQPSPPHPTERRIDPLSSGSNPTPAGPGPGSGTGTGPAQGWQEGSGRMEAGGRLGPYALLQELGRGSNGVVFLARRPHPDDPSHEVTVALKVLLDGAFADAETISRFQLEAAIGMKLDHSGVIRAYDVGRAGERMFYAMEYCPGRTLKQLLRDEGRQPPRRAAELALSLAQTLAHCHGLAVIHRDLKPGNVIMDPREGTPRITDFGLARDRTLMETMTKTGDILGTPYYMAPEQFRGERIDHRVDIYALGVIFYQLLTGERPYEAATPMLLAQVVFDGKPRPPRELAPEVPRELEAICLKAMSPDPDARYATASSLADDLECWLGDKPLRHIRLEKEGALWLPVAAGVLAVGLGAGLAFALFRGDAPSPEPTPSARPPQDGERVREALARARQLLDQPGASLIEVRRILDEARQEVGRDAALAREVGAVLRRLEGREALAEVARMVQDRQPLERLTPGLEQARERATDPAERREVDLLHASLLLRRARWAEGLTKLEPLTQAPPPLGLEAQLLDAQAREALGRLEEAKTAYRALAEAKGGPPQAVVARAALARLEGNRRTVVELTRDRTEPQARIELARAQLQDGDFSAAGLALSAALEACPDDMTVHLLLGWVALREGRHAVAAQELERAQTLCEGTAPRELYLLLGLARAKTKRFGPAEKAFEQLRQREPEAVDALALLGQVQHEAGDEGQAVLSWREAARRDRRRARDTLLSWYTSAEVAPFDEVVERAAPAPSPSPSASPSPSPSPSPSASPAGRGDELSRLFASLDPGSPPAYAAFTPLGSVPKALREPLERAAKDESDAVGSDRAQGHLRALLGKPWDEVDYMLERALRLDDTDQPTLRLRLDLALGRGDPELARKLLARVQLPADERALRTGWLAWQEGHLAAAQRELRVVQGPRAAEAQAWAALIGGDYPGALAAAKRAAEADAQRAGAWIAQGLAQAATGDHAAAKESAERAYALVGACDGRLLALRAVLGAARMMEKDLFAQAARVDFGDTGRTPEEQLFLARSPGYKLLTARIALESRHPAHKRLAARLLDGLRRSANTSAELALLRACLFAVAGKQAEARAECEAALKRDLELPIPAHFRERLGRSGLGR
ncbi:MAG: protein kinase [Planctomycetota bacterium]